MSAKLRALLSRYSSYVDVESLQMEHDRIARLPEAEFNTRIIRRWRLQQLAQIKARIVEIERTQRS